MDEVEGWWITANVRRVPMSACRVEDRFFNLCGELCIMENEMKIHSQLDETKLKLDSSSLYYEVGPTRPALAQRVSERSRVRVRADCLLELDSTYATERCSTERRAAVVSAQPQCLTQFP